jgi:hypothetical protein
MNDDELQRRLAESLRAKADQVPEPTGGFDASAPLVEVEDRASSAGRGPWLVVLAAAAVVALVVGVTAAVLAFRSDGDAEPAAPPTSTTTTTGVETTTTTEPVTTTTTTTTSPATSTTIPTLPGVAMAFDDFNRNLSTLPLLASSDARRLALIFTDNDPPPTEPVDALRVEEETLPDGHHEVVVFEKHADDSVAESRYHIVFTRQPDGSWRIADATRAHRCQPGRGHQEYTITPCV